MRGGGEPDRLQHGIEQRQSPQTQLYVLRHIPTQRNVPSIPWHGIFWTLRHNPALYKTSFMGTKDPTLAPAVTPPETSDMAPCVNMPGHSPSMCDTSWQDTAALPWTWRPSDLTWVWPEYADDTDLNQARPRPTIRPASGKTHRRSQAFLRVALSPRLQINPKCAPGGTSRRTRQSLMASQTRTRETPRCLKCLWPQLSPRGDWDHLWSQL